MPRPYKGYKINGEVVPGVTTIIGRFKESGGLIHWAWKEGIEGRDYRDARDNAALAGNLAHEYVEEYIKRGHTPLPPENELEEKAHNAFKMFVKWKDQTKLTIEETEMRLVSPIYKFGGTPDALGRVGQEYCLLDWKSSNSVYLDYRIQLAAYKHLVEFDKDIRINGFHLVRFSKEHGDFSHHYYDDLSDEWEQFKLFRQAYELDRKLKKRK